MKIFERLLHRDKAIVLNENATSKQVDFNGTPITIKAPITTIDAKKSSFRKSKAFYFQRPANTNSFFKNYKENPHLSKPATPNDEINDL